MSRCCLCGKSKPNVRLRPDPYEQKFNGRIQMNLLCEHCSARRETGDLT